jgi:hypothetical protein
MSIGRALPPRIRRIAQAIHDHGDYRGLRDGGEQLVRNYADEIGVSITALIHSWERPYSERTAKRREPEREPAVTPEDVHLDEDDEEDPRGDDEGEGDEGDEVDSECLCTCSGCRAGDCSRCEYDSEFECEDPEHSSGHGATGGGDDRDDE